MEDKVGVASHRLEKLEPVEQGKGGGLLSNRTSEEPPVWLLTSAIVTEEIFVSHHEICGLLVQSLHKI